MDHSPFDFFNQRFNSLRLPGRSQRRGQLAKARRALLQFPRLRDAFSFNGRPNGALERQRHSAEGSIAASVHGEIASAGTGFFLTFLVDAHQAAIGAESDCDSPIARL